MIRSPRISGSDRSFVTYTVQRDISAAVFLHYGRRTTRAPRPASAVYRLPPRPCARRSRPGCRLPAHTLRLVGRGNYDAGVMVPGFAWIRRNVPLHVKRHPAEMGAAEIYACMTKLTPSGRCSPSRATRPFQIARLPVDSRQGVKVRILRVEVSKRPPGSRLATPQRAMRHRPHMVPTNCSSADSG